MELKKVYVLIVSIMFVVGTSPLILAATEDTLVITFDPEGDIDIDVSNATFNYTAQLGPVYADQWSNTTGEYFTLYNNGSIAMNTEIKAGNTSSEGDMKLNLSAIAPTTDEYAIYIDDLQFPQYLNESYALHGNYDENLAAAGYKSFDVCLLIGTNLTANHSWQTVNITFRGSIYT